jgi:type VI secretion system protein VasG
MKLTLQLAGQLLAHDDSQSVLKKITVFVDENDDFAYRLDCDVIVALNQMAQYSEDETEANSDTENTTNINSKGQLESSSNDQVNTEAIKQLTAKQVASKKTSTKKATTKKTPAKKTATKKITEEDLS